MSRPHVDQLDRDQLDDLGLIFNDETEDLRPNKSAPEIPVLAHRAGTDPNHPLTQEQEF